MAKFCSKCGNELKEGARFCSVCGNPVKQVQSAQSEATAGTNEERQGVFSQQQGFTAQDMHCLLYTSGALIQSNPLTLKNGRYA